MSPFLGRMQPKACKKAKNLDRRTFGSDAILALLAYEDDAIVPCMIGDRTLFDRRLYPV